MYIELEKYPHRFRLMDVYDDWFPFVQDKLHTGDTIKVYYRTPFQSFIGFGKRYDAYQVEKGENLVFPFSATKKQDLFSFRMTLFLAAFFFGLSFFIKKKTSTDRPDIRAG